MFVGNLVSGLMDLELVLTRAEAGAPHPSVTRSSAVLLAGTTHDDELLVHEGIILEQFQSPYSIRFTSRSAPGEGEDLTVVATIIHSILIGLDTVAKITVPVGPTTAAPKPQPRAASTRRPVARPAAAAAALDGPPAPAPSQPPAGGSVVAAAGAPAVEVQPRDAGADGQGLGAGPSWGSQGVQEVQAAGQPPVGLTRSGTGGLSGVRKPTGKPKGGSMKGSAQALKQGRVLQRPTVAADGPPAIPAGAAVGVQAGPQAGPQAGSSCWPMFQGYVASQKEKAAQGAVLGDRLGSQPPQGLRPRAPYEIAPGSVFSSFDIVADEGNGAGPSTGVGEPQREMPGTQAVDDCDGGLGTADVPARSTLEAAPVPAGEQGGLDGAQKAQPKKRKLCRIDVQLVEPTRPRLSPNQVRVDAVNLYLWMQHFNAPKPATAYVVH